MKKIPILFLISILFIIVQQTFLWKLGILGAVPDIVFVYIVCFALVRNELESIIIALLTGIVRDSFFPFAFGINTIVYILTAYFVGLLQKRIYKDSAIVPMIITLVGTYLKGLISYGYFYLLSYKYDFHKLALETSIIESLYNCLISMLIFKLILKYNDSKLLKQDWKF